MVPETKSFRLYPRCEVASNAEIQSKPSSLSALEILKTSAADREFLFLYLIHSGFILVFPKQMVFLPCFSKMNVFIKIIDNFRLGDLLFFLDNLKEF